MVDASRGAPTEDLAAAFARGREAWPDVDLALDDFLDFARTRLQGEDADVEPHADLYLACACARSAPAALACFERAIMPDVPKAIRRVDADADFVADVAADLRLALLGGASGERSALEGYRGRGPLRSFVMVLAMRRAIDRKRRQREVATDPGALAEAAGEAPDFALTAGGDFKEAFLAALREELSALAPRDRNVLRLHVVEGVPVEAIARMYKVHRATVARWVAQAKETVFAATRASLGERLEVSPATFESFARGEALELDAQLSTFLREGEEPSAS